MITETHTHEVDLFAEITDADGTTVIMPSGLTATVTLTELYAESGKHLRHINGTSGCSHITLGTEDCAENYVEEAISD